MIYTFIYNILDSRLASSRIPKRLLGFVAPHFKSSGLGRTPLNHYFVSADYFIPPCLLCHARCTLCDYQIWFTLVFCYSHCLLIFLFVLYFFFAINIQYYYSCPQPVVNTLFIHYTQKYLILITVDVVVIVIVVVDVVTVIRVESSHLLLFSTKYSCCVHPSYIMLLSRGCLHRGCFFNHWFYLYSRYIVSELAAVLTRIQKEM